jgi:hypothetical protein
MNFGEPDLLAILPAIDRPIQGNSVDVDGPETVFVHVD